jgi:uncharacterized integral membrane protein (TIGR00697 family)
VAGGEIRTVEERAFVVLLSVFVGCITISAVLASKIVIVLGLAVPAGVLAYSITFVVTDVVGEVWGRKRAANVVFGGFVALAFVLMLVRLSLWWPAAPFWHQQEAYRAVLDSTSRIIVASFAAYLVSQYHDVWAFHFWKRLTKKRHLWLRNNLSTAASQFIDSTIFITLAFYGILPIWPLIVGQWVIKLLIALLDTPLTYLLVGILRKALNKQIGAAEEDRCSDRSSSCSGGRINPPARTSDPV